MKTKTAARRGIALLLTAVVAAGLVACAPPADRPTAQFIVGLKLGESPGTVAAATAQDPEATVGGVFDHSLGGFTVSLPPERAADLRDDPRVAFVETDHPLQVQGQIHPTGLVRIGATVNPGLGVNNADDRRVDVDIAVVDSGVDLSHPDLVVHGAADCSGLLGTCTLGGADDNGHGTHVAGTIGALDNGTGTVGVAPGARIWSVKAVNARGAGSVSNIIAALDHVAAHADEIEVVNLSLGCRCTSTALTRAIDNLVSRGVVVVVAAGNGATDSARFSPANHPDVVAVSAVADFDGIAGGTGVATCSADQDDTLADFSNFGLTVDMAAPGACIPSAARGGGMAVMSGTSMAAPHVAGAAGLLASRVKPRNRTGVLALASLLQSTGSTAWQDTSGDGRTEPLLDVSNPVEFAPSLIAGGSLPLPTAPPATITIVGSAARSLGIFRQATLQWSAAAGASVEIYRDGNRLRATANDGHHVDTPGRGAGTNRYRVCNLGRTACSPEITVAA